jgi:hypothetical protein
MKTLYESLFDEEDQLDSIDHNVSAMGKMGIKSIIVKIFDGKNITNDKTIKNILSKNASQKIFKEIDTKVFDKNVKILDEYWEKLHINNETTQAIYTIAERCCEEVLYAQENYPAPNMIDSYMYTWIKYSFNGVGHEFKYWRRSGTFTITFSPKKGDVIVRLICSIRTK